MNTGFSLVELMVVIAIVAILAATAVPAYRDFTYRANLSSMFSEIQKFRIDMQEYYQRNGSFPGQGQGQLYGWGSGTCYSVNGTSTQCNSGNNEINSGGVVRDIYQAGSNGTSFATMGIRLISDTDKIGGAANQPIYLTLTAESNGTMTWACNYSSLPASIQPSVC